MHTMKTMYHVIVADNEPFRIGTNEKIWERHVDDAPPLLFQRGQSVCFGGEPHPGQPIFAVEWTNFDVDRACLVVYLRDIRVSTREFEQLDWSRWTKSGWVPG